MKKNTVKKVSLVLLAGLVGTSALAAPGRGGREGKDKVEVRKGMEQHEQSRNAVENFKGEIGARVAIKAEIARMVESQEEAEKILSNGQSLYQSNPEFHNLLVEIGKSNSEHERKAMSAFLVLRASGLGESADHFVTPKLISESAKWSDAKSRENLLETLNSAARIAFDAQRSGSPMTSKEAMSQALAKRGIKYDEYERRCKQ